MIAMVREGKVHTTVLILQGLLTVGVGLTLFSISATMTNILFEIAGCVAAVLLTAACLVIAGVIDCIGGLEIRKGHRRELHIYLLVGATSMIAGLFFWFSAEGSVQILAMLAGLHGLFWGIWDLRFASHLKDHPRERRVLRVLGGITIGLGILLVAGMEFSSRFAVTLLACYLTYIGVHILLIAMYIYHPWKTISQKGKTYDRLASARQS